MLRSQISPSCAHNALGGLIDNMYMTASELRRAIRAGDFTGPTAGCAAGYVQTNLVVLPAEAANEFAEFCRLNDRPCPLVAQTPPGMYEPGETLTAALSQGAREWVAAGADLRTDVPKYRVFRHGVLEPNEPTDIRGLWRNDFVAFLLGCSFTFENALMRAGLTVRHIALGRNVPMYRTTVACRSAGRFRGPLVVSMRPYRPDQIEAVTRITAGFPRMHGAPVHIGDPAAIGIADISRPDFGDAVTIEPGEVPVFWACGVTPQLAILEAKPEIAITHSPGHMFVTDLREPPG